MFDFTAQQVTDATSATLVAGPADIVCHDCVFDSRLAQAGSLFVAFPGEFVDGNDYAEAAAAAGATVIAMTGTAPEGLLEAAHRGEVAVLHCDGDDGEEFLLRLAASWRAANPQWKVVGVTGSVGKTTTKDMCAAALATRYRVHATSGNFNNLIGMPATLLSASAEDEALVVEMGMNHTGEISRLTRACRPDVALVTNVGTSHIGFLGSQENIARAKAEILEGMGPSSRPTASGVTPMLALVDGDGFTDFISTQFAEPAGVDVMLVGGSDAAAVRARDVELDAQGHPSFTLEMDGLSRPTTLPVASRQLVSDFLLAMAVSVRLGADAGEAAAAVEAMKPTHMRLEVVEAACGARVIDDSYNASPSSMAAALDVLCAMELPEGGRRIAVLGQIGELGASAAHLHSLIGAYAAAKPLDLIAFVGGEDADSMAAAARIMGFSDDKIERFDDVEAAIKVIPQLLGPHDLVLAKGSRSVGLDRLVQEVR